MHRRCEELPRTRRRRAGLRHRIVFWFGITILASGGIAGAVLHTTIGRNPWREEVRRIRTFTANQFAQVWSDPARRDALAEDMARDLEVSVKVTDASGRLLSEAGGPCSGGRHVIPVARGGVSLGDVRVCIPRHTPPSPGSSAVAFFAAVAVLWAMAGILARHLTRPLAQVADVARRLGNGELSARVRMRGRATNEVALLADTINEMAARVERQLADQRELLAAVSHELRTPLTRLRVLTELVRDGNFDEKSLQSMEAEIAELDALVAQLLASSRLEFDTLTRTTLHAATVALEAMDRAGIPAELLEDTSGDATFEGDGALIGRALANLIANAKGHGQGVTRVRVWEDDTRVGFDVEDGGPGLSREALSSAFKPFFREGESAADGRSALGMGLALVERIARAHGGEARASNLSVGARIGFVVARGK